MRSSIVIIIVLAVSAGCSETGGGSVGVGESGKADGFTGCEGPNPAGCLDDSECDEGLVCDLDECGATACECEDDLWICTADCRAGLCVPPACEGANPEGCLDDSECGEGSVCDLDECGATACECEDGAWIGRAECGAGVCVAPACEGPAPTGCLDDSDCDDDAVCDFDECGPSACACDLGAWVCTDDCFGGHCMPVL